MDFIQTATKHTDKFGAGKHGFQAGNPGVGTLATKFSATWADNVQQEIVNAIEGAGIAINNGDQQQLLKAIKRIAGANVTTIVGTQSINDNHAGLVLIDATAGNIVITLPAASLRACLPYLFYRTDNSVNTVTIQRAGGDGIDQGLTNFTLPAQGDYRGILAGGASTWFTSSIKPAAAAAAGRRHGQCYLSLASGSAKLLPENGDGLMVNGVLCSIPAAGVTLAPTGLTVGQNYYLYATASAGVVNALVPSTSARGVHTDGVAIMSGDATKTLVGLVRVVAGPAFVDAGSQRFLLSWFNRRDKFAQIDAATQSITSTPTEYSATRAEFLCWGDDTPEAMIGGLVTQNSGGVAITATLCVDGSALSNAALTGSNLYSFSPCIDRQLAGLAEGYHHASAQMGSASGTWNYVTPHTHVRLHG